MGRPPRHGTPLTKRVQGMLTDAEYAEMCTHKGEQSESDYVRAGVLRENAVREKKGRK